MDATPSASLAASAFLDASKALAEGGRKPRWKGGSTSSHEWQGTISSQRCSGTMYGGGGKGCSFLGLI